MRFLRWLYDYMFLIVIIVILIGILIPLTWPWMPHPGRAAGQVYVKCYSGERVIMALDVEKYMTSGDWIAVDTIYGRFASNGDCVISPLIPKKP